MTATQRLFSGGAGAKFLSLYGAPNREPEMGALTHVTRRGAAYVWRRRVPKRALKGREGGLSTKNAGAMLQVSLQTRDLSTAARRAAVVSTAFDDMLDSMTEYPLTRAQARQYLEAVVQSEIERLEAARWWETPPASTKEWRRRWMRDRAEAYAFRLLASRGPGAELLCEDMDKLRAEGFHPPDMATVAEALYDLSDKYYRDREPLGPNPADIIGHDTLTEQEQSILTREAMKGAALARERLDRRQAELADREPSAGDCEALPFCFPPCGVPGGYASPEIAQAHSVLAGRCL